ncbi:MAG: thioredoxin domain-containing protein, partial [Lewinella sp.]|nr:thioredoxin domain-containing protein [Lewinella sp.]
SEPAYRDAALRGLHFLLDHYTQTDGSLWHTYKDGEARYPGFIDDYAFLVAALLDVYTITFDHDFIDRALTFTEYALTHFLDREDNLFYFTSDLQEDIPLRRKEIYDSATPSGNATMALNMQRLAMLTGRPEWDQLSVAMLQPMADSIERYPTSFGRWARALLFRTFPSREIAVVGSQALDWGVALQSRFFPNTVAMATKEPTDAYPLLAGRNNQDGDTQIYVCQQYACQLPVRNVEDALAQLATI